MPPIRTQSRLEVLVVDDDADTRSLIVDFCNQSGFSVTQAHDGRAALTAITRGTVRFAVVVTDLHMPGADGFEVLRRLRSNPQSRRAGVIVVTGHALPRDVANARLRGANAVLTKPCDPQALCDAVDELVAAAFRRAPEAPRPGGSSPPKQLRPIKPERRSHDARHGPRTLEGLFLWSDFVVRQAEGLRHEATALCGQALEIRRASRALRH